MDAGCPSVTPPKWLLQKLHGVTALASPRFPLRLTCFSPRFCLLFFDVPVTPFHDPYDNDDVIV